MSSGKLKKIVVVLGPTCSGKSVLAAKLARQFNGQLVSADARQIYKGLDIGTAKTKNIQLVDLIRPDQEFSLAQYQKLAIKKITAIHQSQQLPILVGGTGLYIRAVVDNLKIPTVKPNKKLRAKIAKEIQAKGLKAVYQKLLKLDPKAKNFVDPKNSRRIIRALEVCLLTKRPFSQARKKGQPLFDTLQIGLKTPLAELDQKIDQRVDQMFKKGLVAENKKLLKKYSPKLAAFSAIGYQEISQYLHGQISLDQAKALIKLHTRQYARRQMTWFKKDKRIHWVDNYPAAAELVTTLLS